MKISVSQFLDWLECPFKAKIKDTYARWEAPGSALGIGIAFHRALELKLAGKLVEGLDLAWCLQACRDAKDAATAGKLIAALAKAEQPPGRSIASEKAFSMPYKGHTIVGRLDGIWESPNGCCWSDQGKTISSSLPIAQELERVRLSHHEIIYHWLAEANGQPIEGTLVRVGVKLTKKATEAGQAPYFHEFMERQRWEVDALLPGLFKMFDRYIEDMLAPPEPAAFKNTKACLGKYGNSPCPLFTHCHQHAALEGVIETYLTHPLEDRYGEIEGSAE